MTQTGASSEAARTRSFVYDGLSRLITASNPETGTVCYGQWGNGKCVTGYDDNGNLLHKTDARGVTTNYAYDALNRLLSKTYANDASGALASCYQYDTLGGGGTNLVGRLTAEWTQKLASGAACPSTKPSGAMTSRTLSAYDAMGRVTSETQCVGASCTKNYANSPTYAYDLAGNLTLYGNLLGTAQFTNAYDTAGRLSSVTNAWTGAAQVGPLYPATLFSAPSYAPFGGLSGATYGTGLNLTRTYDSRLRVTGEIDMGSPGSGPATPGKAVISITGGVQSK